MSILLPSISVVIEWENAKTSELARARDMLLTLLGQMRCLSNQFAGPPELIFVHNEDHEAAGTVMEQVREEMASFGGKVEVVVGNGEDYYDQKNLGVRYAGNELILFVDSDIIPEDGWLERLIKAHLEEGADVTGGLTHIGLDSFYERAFASFWFFPVAGEVKERARANGFAANNVLFRAEVARDNPFPDTGHVRGRCLRLAEQLVDDGYKIVLEPGARVSHPPPNGFSHFVRRALCQGHDNKLRDRSGGQLITLRQFYWDMRRSGQRIAMHRRALGMPVWEAVGAFAVAGAYYGVAAVGEIVSMINPGLIPNKAHV